MIKYPASVIEVNYLKPLKKWKILHLQSLMAKANHELDYLGFAKALISLEKKDLVKSIRMPKTRKKYFYLTPEGDAELGAPTPLAKINNDTFPHDTKVIELVEHFMSLGFFDDFFFDHDLVSNKPNAIVQPDAVLIKNKKIGKSRCALELELSHKTKSKYLNKIEKYLKSDYYELVLYYFRQINTLRSYQKTIEEKFGKEAFNKISFAYNPNVMQRDFNFFDTKVIYTTKEILIENFFKR